MSSFNSVVLLGRLTRDPELRYTPQGKAVCDIGLAVNRRFTRQDGEKVDEATFVDITCWNRLAEVTAEFLKKGRLVLVSGHLVLDRWEDASSGQKRSKLKVVADGVQFVSGGSKDDAAATDSAASLEEVTQDSPADASEKPPVAPRNVRSRQR